MRHFLFMAPLLLAPATVVAQPSPAPAATGGTPAATPAGTTATPPSADPGQVVQCRRYQVTGSLAQTQRVCRTVAEWNRQSRIGNEAARDMVGLGANPDYANPPGGG